MKTAEQKARDMLTAMECVSAPEDDGGGEPTWREPKDFSASELVELANLIAQHSFMRRTLAKIAESNTCQRHIAIGWCVTNEEKRAWCGPCRAWDATREIDRRCSHLPP